MMWLSTANRKPGMFIRSPLYLLLQDILGFALTMAAEKETIAMFQEQFGEQVPQNTTTSSDLAEAWARANICDDINTFNCTFD